MHECNVVAVVGVDEVSTVYLNEVPRSPPPLPPRISRDGTLLQVSVIGPNETWSYHTHASHRHRWWEKKDSAIVKRNKGAPLHTLQTELGLKTNKHSLKLTRWGAPVPSSLALVLLDS